LPSGAFEEHTAPHSSGAFLDQRLEEAEETGPALIYLPGEVAGFCKRVERIENGGRELLFRVHRSNLNLAAEPARCLIVSPNLQQKCNRLFDGGLKRREDLRPQGPVDNTVIAGEGHGHQRRET
jgi:hypothetical protein